jgi:MoaA/NifB/PqqE/SkfB family radical SAM enzyme
MTAFTSLKAKVAEVGLKAVLPWISKLSNEQLLHLVPPIPVRNDGSGETLRDVVREDTVVLNLLRRIAASATPEQVNARIQRYIVNPIVRGGAARRDAHERHGIAGLASITITPLIACNLECDLCYNTPEIHHDPKEQLPTGVIDRVMHEAKSIGAYRFTFIGGEPLIRWKDIRELARIHSDAVISVFTNGLLLTDEVATELASLGNVEMSFSIDGLEKSNDLSRGQGTFRKILAAMDRYREAGGMMVYSPTVTSENYEELLSDEFIDLMLSKGCYMGYYHHYDLIGGQTRTELLLSLQQLQWMEHRIHEIAKTKPISISDAVLSKLIKGGCHAVREFVHVNHRGMVEPCCMVPFAADTVLEKSLIEVLQSKFFGRLNAIEKDDHGIKRCLVGENSDVLKGALADGIAEGTTKVSEALFDIEKPDGRLFPTCFSSERPGTNKTNEKSSKRVRLPTL